MPIVKCDYCGKEVSKKQSQLDKNKYHFCNKQHYDLFQQKPNNIVLKETHAEIIINKHDKELIVLIDLDDVEKVKQAKWMAKYDKTVNNYYIHAWERNTTENNRKRLILHRLLINCPDGMESDHINRNTLDNRKCNLRITTPMENKQNKGFYKNNKSGHKYIHRNNYSGLWIIEIKRNNIKTRIGSRKDLNEAIQIRNDYLKKIGIILDENS